MNAFIVDIVLVLLVALSIVTWTVAVIKLRLFKRLVVLNQLFQDEFWASNHFESARKVTLKHSCEMATIAKLGFDEIDAYKNKHASLKYAGELEDVLIRPLQQEIQKTLRHNESGMAVLATIGSTAPFVGLFGTVWGIMGALKEIGARGQASIDIVAGPIGEALIATAVGIAVALPAVVFYNFFLRKLKVWSTELDGFVEAYVRMAQQQVKV